MIDQTITELHGLIGTAPACRALGVSRASVYRRRQRKCPLKPVAKRRTPRALCQSERDAVLVELHSERFQDCSPAEVYATLLDEGRYLASERTMYRILADHGEIRERRNQLIHPHYQRPELLAQRPNELWSWDITKLKGPAKWSTFQLYVILDVFSRYVIGWTIEHRESAVLAENLIAQTLAKQQIQRDQLTIHADRGASMRSKNVAFLLADLGVTKTHNRPHVSNDNPYSEAQFKTLKYRPNFPERFGSIEDAREFCRTFFDWYNNQHRHSGIGQMTPTAVHHGQADQIYTARSTVLAAAYSARPERFVRKPPQPPALPTVVWINEPAAEEAIP